MEEWLKVLTPMLGSLAGIAALWWKVTTSVATKTDIGELRDDMNRADENLQKQINQAINLTLDVTKDIREDMRQMRSEIQRLGDKIDANSQLVHTDISKLNDKIDANIATLNDKIDANSQVLHEKIDSVANDLRAEIRQWKQ